MEDTLPSFLYDLYRKNLMRAKRKLTSLALLPFGMIILCSCSALSVGTTENSAVINQGSAETDSSTPTVSSTPKPVTSPEPKTSTNSDTARLESSLNQSLKSLASSVDYPSVAQIEDATRQAASDQQAIEISPVETPTGLRADSIQVAFVVDSKECIFGYIRGNNVSTSVLPVLSNGKCMVGAHS